jgi:hypothetical protein
VGGGGGVVFSFQDSFCEYSSTETSHGVCRYELNVGTLLRLPILEPSSKFIENSVRPVEPRKTCNIHSANLLLTDA